MGKTEEKKNLYGKKQKPAEGGEGVQRTGTRGRSTGQYYA